MMVRFLVAALLIVLGAVGGYFYAQHDKLHSELEFALADGRAVKSTTMAAKVLSTRLPERMFSRRMPERFQELAKTTRVYTSRPTRRE